MKNNFRTYHVNIILNSFECGKIPLDIFLSNYFRRNKSIGSKDRKYIAETIYTIVRWKGLIDYELTKPITWEKRFDKLDTLVIDDLIKDKTIPSYIRASFPEEYFNKIKSDYGEEKALEICIASNYPAPTVIRSNTIKTSRDQLFKSLSKQYNVSKCTDVETGIIFNHKINFFVTEEFKNGLFEIQDAGSQIIADMVSPKDNSHVLDFCSGSGGKALAFAPKMNKKGQIYLHDIRPRALIEAKKRLKRAGIQNAQIVQSDELEKKIKHQSMDWILLDVPCSGSGTLRRNADMKWKFDFSEFDNLLKLQQSIFLDAIKYLKPKGKIVYATCSIFKEENDKQIEYFMEKHSFKLIEKKSWLPMQGEKDGFFGAILEKK